MWRRLADRGPILASAPLANCSDAAFRRMLAKYSQRRTVIWNEFVNTTGMLHEDGWRAMAPDLAFSEAERPIIAQVRAAATATRLREPLRPCAAQIFGSDPSEFERCASKLADLGFDGIDINMVRPPAARRQPDVTRAQGCPVAKVAESQQAGAALIEDPGRARAIVEAARAGARGVPVSVKTRTGFDAVEVPHWLHEVAAAGPAAITLHARTRKEMSAVPARWDLVRHCATSLRAEHPDIVFIGNGDVQCADEAVARCASHGVDGVMVGRALFGRPWLFGAPPAIRPAWLEDRTAVPPLEPGAGVAAPDSGPTPPIGPEPHHVVQLALMAEHALLFDALLLSRRKSFSWMTKYFKAYCTGFAGAKALRAHLMHQRSATSVLGCMRLRLLQGGADRVWHLVHDHCAAAMDDLQAEAEAEAAAPAARDSPGPLPGTVAEAARSLAAAVRALP